VLFRQECPEPATQPASAALKMKGGKGNVRLQRMETSTPIFCQPLTRRIGDSGALAQKMSGDQGEADELMRRSDSAEESKTRLRRFHLRWKARKAARTDLSGGREATRVLTATQRSWRDQPVQVRPR
jgi:hypothetical protein